MNEVTRFGPKERTKEGQEKINAAMSLRPKIKLIKDYGKTPAGTVMQVSNTRRRFLVDNGFAKIEK